MINSLQYKKKDEEREGGERGDKLLHDQISCDITHIKQAWS